jgi:hypothetical protein
MACPFFKTAMKCFLGALKNPEMKTGLDFAVKRLHNQTRFYKQFFGRTEKSGKMGF